MNTFESVAALIIVLLLLVYLVIALVNPEKF